MSRATEQMCMCTRCTHVALRALPRWLCRLPRGAAPVLPCVRCPAGFAVCHVGIAGRGTGGRWRTHADAQGTQSLRRIGHTGLPAACIRGVMRVVRGQRGATLREGERERRLTA
eukprot:360359-Chlamydomonas_euryale.AAC.3